MTVAAELAKRAQRMEYFICIEGIGWPTDEADLSSGFDGDVFTTADQDADLATQLGCTVHSGLQRPGAISDHIDTRALLYEVGGMNFEIADVDEWLLANLSPYRTGTTSVLTAELDYNHTTVEDDGHADGDVIWVGGRECVLLGTGGPGTYVNCTRGYLGTPRGRVDFELTGFSEYAWATSTSTNTVNKFLHDRRVALFAHVPGEAAVNCVRLYSGRIRGPIKARGSGDMWSFTSVGEKSNGLSRVVNAPGGWFIKDVADILFSSPTETLPGESWYFAWRVELEYRGSGDNSRELYALAAFYHYRTEPGGTAGMKTNAFGTSPQARDIDSDGDDDIRAFALFGDKLVRVLKRAPGEESTVVIVAMELDPDGSLPDVKTFDVRSPVRFLLDSYPEYAAASRFVVSNELSRNPVDVLLMYLTSGPNEYYVADATGGTTTVPTFAACGPADLWIGAALHCVEGTNKGEARVISDNGTTSITADTAFSNAPAAATEYQVRNSIYDVLPFGWGMNVHYDRIDIDSFEEVRDKFLADAQLTRFFFGEEDSYDLWEVLQENICRPYGIFTYINRATGKLTARYLGDAYGDGVIDDYVSVSASDILRVGDITYDIGNPLYRINLRTRAGSYEGTPLITNVTGGVVGSSPPPGGSSQLPMAMTALYSGGVVTTVIKSTDLEGAYIEDNLNEIDISAMFNSVEELPYLVAHLYGHLRRHQVPPPKTSLDLDFEKLLTVQAGTMLALSWEGVPIDPYSADRGWTSVAARVLGTTMVLSGGEQALQCEVELLFGMAAAKIAPACTVTSKGNDGTYEYVVVNLTDYALSGEDWDELLPGDKIELRDKNGALKEAIGRIENFGSNHSSTPGAAADARINVDDASIDAAIVAGDYVTFIPWVNGGNTANMEIFSAYADAGEDLGGGDTAKEYG